MARGMTFQGVTLWVVLLFVGLAALLAHNLLWYDFIRGNFAYNGEDYYKTIGGVIREDYWKGLFLTIGDPFSFWLIVAFVTVTLIPHERITFRIIAALAGLYLLYILLYAGTKSYDLYQGTFDNKERVIAISAAGIGRLVGVALGGWLAVRLDVFGRISALLQKNPYQRQTHQLR